ncbi:hypothetical protein SAMN04490356_4399 [Streptomyces melanosporofaciens]|uniref:Uncharacterized protein n=1 Tax=Streptomyces melanosporofaciens TaxID=67327 RepID=A0A1H4T1C7_STRMJ|nr:hypothetical protein SAMN04490356_4399 [Streptomyces melanosporofaciens]
MRPDDLTGPELRLWEAPQLYGATLRVTSFGGSCLPGLGMGATTVDGNLEPTEPSR